MEIEARVLQVDADGSAWVQAVSGGESCHSCGSSGDGCATGNIGRMFASREQRYRVANILNSRTGDRVVLGIADGSVLRGSAAVYLAPLALMFAGAFLFSRIPALANDGGELAGALTGFALACLWLWRFNRKIRLDPRFRPVILRPAQSTIMIRKEWQS